MSFFGTIYADEELPHRARAVYMYLRDRANAEGKCWPGVKRIAADLRSPAEQHKGPSPIWKEPA